MRIMRRLVVAGGLVIALVMANSATASAGEITGKGSRPMVESTYEYQDEDGVTHTGHVLNGKSECAFSGLNDEYVLDLPSDGFGRTQNWGQLPKFVRDEIGAFGAHPGDSCNPTKGAPVEP